MITRRRLLKFTAIASSAMSLTPQLLTAAENKLITRAIPSTGEQIPMMGLGSAATFSQMTRNKDTSALLEVMRTLFDNGGTVFDTAPSYRSSEEVAGRIVNELDAKNKVFWATKLNAASRITRNADPDAARAQIETSFRYIGRSTIDLIQIHNLADIETQLTILKKLKAEGRVRYIGVTSTRASQYPYLEQIMRNEPIDFIGVDYAVDNREPANIILPLAQKRKIGVMIYLPFGRTRLWRRVSGRNVPEWASEFDATSWAHFFLKYIISHPAVTVVTPATTKVSHMLDNLGGAIGRLPNETMRQRMAEFVDALP